MIKPKLILFFIILFCIAISGVATSESNFPWAVSGHVYEDINKNQIFDDEEEGIEGVNVYFNKKGILPNSLALETSTTTNSYGYYECNDLSGFRVSISAVPNEASTTEVTATTEKTQIMRRCQPRPMNFGFIIEEEIPPAPTVEISSVANDMSATSFTITWNTDNAADVSISGIGPVDLEGSIIVTPEETITYTITATGPGGTATASTIIKIPIIPTVTLSVDYVPNHDSPVLSWDTKNVTDIGIHCDSQGIRTYFAIENTQLPKGSITIPPYNNAECTVVVWGIDGIVATDSVTVLVD